MIFSLLQLQQLLRQTGFPESRVAFMAAIGMAESSGNSSIINPGRPGHPEYSVGLWQINTRVHHNYSVQQLTDPQINAREALRILNTEGLNAWGSYTDGRYRRWLAESQRVAGNASSVPAPIGASQGSYATGNSLFGDSSISPGAIGIGLAVVALLVFVVLD
jgi:hypothetical protein